MRREDVRCPVCKGYPQVYTQGDKVVAECCKIRVRGKTGQEAKANWRTAVVQREKRAEEIGELWDKALGKPSEWERERNTAKRLMNNDAVVEKRLNAFHDGRLMR